MSGEITLHAGTFWICPVCENQNILETCENCGNRTWALRRGGGEHDYYVQCVSCNDRFYTLKCYECHSSSNIVKIFPIPESHPWMKFFTYVVIFAGITMFFVAAGILGDEYKTLSEKLPAALLLGSGGVLATWAGVYSLRVTREFTRLSELPSNKRAIAVMTATIGGLLSSFVVIILFMAYAALKAEAESNQRS